MTDNQDNTGTSRFWNNQAFLNPTFGTNEYAKTYTGLQFTAKVIGNRNNENTDNAAENLTLNSTQYVLNYTPLANAVAGLDTTTQKQVAAQYKEGGWQICWPRRIPLAVSTRQLITMPLILPVQ